MKKETARVPAPVVTTAPPRTMSAPSGSNNNNNNNNNNNAPSPTVLPPLLQPSILSQTSKDIDNRGYNSNNSKDGYNTNKDGQSGSNSGSGPGSGPGSAVSRTSTPSSSSPSTTQNPSSFPTTSTSSQSPKKTWDTLNGRDPSASHPLPLDFVFAQPTVFPSRDPKT